MMITDTCQLSRASRLLCRPIVLGGWASQGVPSQSACPREEEVDERLHDAAFTAALYGYFASCKPIIKAVEHESFLYVCRWLI